MPRKVLIVGAVVAAVVVVLLLRRRANAAAATAGAPPLSTSAAITSLFTTPPQQLAGAALQAGASYVAGQIGAGGTMPIVPQNTPKPEPCPPGFVGMSPISNTYCTGQTKTQQQALTDAIKREIARTSSTNYNPAAGYYG